MLAEFQEWYKLHVRWSNFGSGQCKSGLVNLKIFDGELRTRYMEPLLFGGSRSRPSSRIRSTSSPAGYFNRRRFATCCRKPPPQVVNPAHEGRPGHHDRGVAISSLHVAARELGTRHWWCLRKCARPRSHHVFSSEQCRVSVHRALPKGCSFKKIICEFTSTRGLAEVTWRHFGG